MTSPFVEGSKPMILQSLEAECARRYSAQAAALEAMLTENRSMNARMAIASECIQWYAAFAGTTAINYDAGKRARLAIARLEDLR